MLHLPRFAQRIERERSDRNSGCAALRCAAVHVPAAGRAGACHHLAKPSGALFVFSRCRFCATRSNATWCGSRLSLGFLPRLVATDALSSLWRSCAERERPEALRRERGLRVRPFLLPRPLGDSPRGALARRREFGALSWGGPEGRTEAVGRGSSPLASPNLSISSPSTGGCFLSPVPTAARSTNRGTVGEVSGSSAFSRCGSVPLRSLAVLQSASPRFSAAVKIDPASAANAPGSWDRLSEYGTSDPWPAYHRWPVSPQRGRPLSCQDRPAISARLRRGPSCGPLWGSVARFRALCAVPGPFGALWRALARSGALWRSGRSVAPRGALRPFGAPAPFLFVPHQKKTPFRGFSGAVLSAAALSGLRHLGPEGPSSSIRGAVNVRSSCFRRASHVVAASA